MSKQYTTDPQTEEPQETRARIIAAASRVLATKGYDATTLREISREAQAAPGGCVLMDIFSPWWWARQAGKVETYKELGLTQRYDFDPTGCRFIDQWWPADDQSQVIAQTARCYTPVDLILLVKGTGLAIDLLEIDGTPISLSKASTMEHALSNTESYLAKLIPAVS